MGFIRQLGKALLSTCAPRSRFLVRGARASGGALPSLSLTFDDGPDPIQTPRVLDRLAQYGLHATFFVIGKKVASHPEICRRIVAEGHEVGNHTWSHAEPGAISASAFVREIADTARLLSDVCGIECRLARPPHGKLTYAKLRGLWRLRQTAVLWNVDTRDFRMSSNEHMENWCEQYHPRAGDIVLFHDDRPFGAVAIDELRRLGVFDRFACVPVSHWLPRQQTTKCEIASAERNQQLG